jgi:hypothetical protein
LNFQKAPEHSGHDLRFLVIDIKSVGTADSDRAGFASSGSATAADLGYARMEADTVRPTLAAKNNYSLENNLTAFDFFPKLEGRGWERAARQNLESAGAPGLRDSGMGADTVGRTIRAPTGIASILVMFR